MRQLAWLIGLSFVFWVAAGLAARDSEGALLLNSTACGLCLLPAIAAVVWADRGRCAAPEHQLLMMVASMGLRMLAALGGGLLLFLAFPYFHQLRFWIWILVYYLFTLALETALIVAWRGRPSAT